MNFHFEIFVLIERILVRLGFLKFSKRKREFEFELGERRKIPLRLEKELDIEEGSIDNRLIVNKYILKIKTKFNPRFKISN